MQTACIEPEVGGVYLASDLLHEPRRTRDLFENLATTKMNNNNNNDIDEETSIKEEPRELKQLPSNLQIKSEVPVTSTPFDFRKQIDYAVDCSPSNVTSSSTPSDEMVVTPTKNSPNDVINDEYDEYACDTPLSLSPSRDSLASVTSSDKLIGSSSAFMLPTTPMNGNGGVTSPGHMSGGSATVSARCPPVREAVDPAKYITLSGEADGVKYACSKCGNVYKWRKSLNKHWKEKHDGETPYGQSPTSGSVRLAIASSGGSVHHRNAVPLGISQRHLTSPFDKHSVLTGNERPMYTSGVPLKTSPASSLTSSSSISGLAAAASAQFRQPTKGSLAELNPTLFGKFSLHPKSGSSRISSHHQQYRNLHHNHRQSSQVDNSSSASVTWTSQRAAHVDPTLRATATQNASTSSSKPVDYFRLAYDAAASTSSRIEAPVDLSESSRSYRQPSTIIESGDDMDVLDLSKKCSENGRTSQKSSLLAAEDYLPVQDEPLDFSLKVAPTSARTSPIDFAAAVPVPHPGSTLFAGHLHQQQVAKNAFPFAPHNVASSAEFSNQKSEVGPFKCTQCPQQFLSPTKLSRHYSREHVDAISFSGDDRRHPPRTECSPGSAQLYRYLTANAALPLPVVAHRSDRTGSGGDSTSCLVCGQWFASRSAAARHFDDHHSAASVGLINPYRQHPAMTGNRPESDENSVRKNAVNRTQSHSVHSPPVSATAGFPALASSDDLLMVHCTDEQTAIVIPQAPEDTSALSKSASSMAALSKMFVPNAHPPRVGNASTGRSRRAELLGFSISSSGTTTSSANGGTPSAEILLPFKCQLCEYRARWPSEMTQHAKNHSDEKPFRCPQCSYRSKWKWDVVKHLKRCGGGNCTARDVIDMSASMGNNAMMTTGAEMPAALQQQQHQQQPQKSGTFSTQRRRRFQTVRSVLINVQHQQQQLESEQQKTSFLTPEKHNIPEENILMPPPARDEVDNTSSARGPTVKTECVVDMSGVHGDIEQCKQTSPPMPLTEPLPEASVKTEVEHELATAADDSSPLLATIDDVTLSSDQGLHYCVQCPFVGHSPAELRRHQRVHSDEKPYSCRSCSYSSKWKCDLKKHLRAYNHVSAVPLVYGGHGRKPALPADWGLGRLGLVDARDLVGLVRDSDFYDQTQPTDAAGGVLTSGFGDGVPYERGQAQSKGKTAGEQGGNGLAAGITTGGRLRCRRCDFEAVDITSFLHHKTLHHGNRYEDGTTLRPVTMITHDVMAGNGGSRKRKSSKQHRVFQLVSQPDAQNISADMSDGTVEMRPIDEEKFWKSLGLKSCDGSVSMKPPVPEVGRQQETTSSMSTQCWNVGKSGLSSSPVQDEVMDCDNVSTLSESTSGLDESDYPEVMLAIESAAADGNTVDEPVDLCSRRKDEDQDDISASESTMQRHEESSSNFTAGRAALNGGGTSATAHVRRHWSWSKGIEGCSWRSSLNASDMSASSTGGGSPAEVDDMAAMSRRKRKLRTCDKCGYVTDNLTTLQRHRAKHGSTGRHRCSLCTYTVERQHILDYHMKIVHCAPQTPAAIASSDLNTRPLSLDNSFNDQSQLSDDFEPDPDITFSTKHRLTNEDHKELNVTSDDQRNTGQREVQTSLKEGDSPSVNHVPMMPLRAGLGVGRSCIRCGFISRTDGSAARHRLIGHSALNFWCGHDGCERRACSTRVLAKHRGRVHSRHVEVSSGSGVHASCSECPYRSASPSRVTRHARLHVQPQRKHRCPDCSYSVHRRSLLGHHRRLHDRKTRIQTVMTSNRLRCADCPFRCRSSAQLAVHRRHHVTGNGKTAARRRFECTQCSFGVDVSNAFQHHYKLHSSGSR